MGQGTGILHYRDQAGAKHAIFPPFPRVVLTILFSQEYYKQVYFPTVLANSQIPFSEVATFNLSTSGAFPTSALRRELSGVRGMKFPDGGRRG
jgi:hypothetical protein